MSNTTTKNIMDYIKDFITQAGEEEWDTDFMLRAWEEKSKDIEKIIEEGTPKTKKVSSPKDPNKPKRGKSAYIFFCGEARVEVKEEMDDAKPQEVMRELGIRWKTLKESPRKADKTKMAKYTKMAEEDKARSTQEMETYVPPSEEELVAAKPKRGRKTTVKKSDKPTRGRSAYIYFCSENRAEVKEENEGVIGSVITKLLGEMWSELKDDEDREDELRKYKDMAVEDKKRYESEMESYVPNEDDEKPSYVPNEDDEKPKAKKSKKEPMDTTYAEGFKKFCNANRQDTKDENPDLKPVQITKLLKDEWAEMDDTEKKDWSEEEQE